jgi:hypothetical protein
MYLMWFVSWKYSLSLQSFKSRRPKIVHRYLLCFIIKVTFGHKLRYEIKCTFGEISLKLCQTNWNVAINNINVVVDGLPSQITTYTCSTIGIWTWRHQCTSTHVYALWCHSPKMAGFQWKGRQRLSTLLWTPPTRWKGLSESYPTHVVSCLESENWPLSPRIS